MCRVRQRVFASGRRKNEGVAPRKKAQTAAAAMVSTTTTIPMLSWRQSLTPRPGASKAFWIRRQRQGCRDRGEKP